MSAAELDDFKRTVVRTAQRYAARHGWCNVVNQALLDMGLVEYMPTRIVVQQRQHSGERWSHYSDHRTVRTALKAAKQARSQALRYLKDEWQRKQMYAAADPVTVEVPVGVDADLDAALEQVRAAHQQRVRVMQPFAPPNFPKFRAVEKDAAGTVLRVLEEGDE